MNRTQDYYRHHRNRVIEKKKKFAKQCYGINYYKVDGKYSKGKIHCSCPMCSNKTKIHGFSKADICKRDKMNFQEI